MSSPESGADRWIVVNTHTNRELQAIENLDRQGFESYCPRVRVRIRHARQQKEVLRPLFRGYLFVRQPPPGKSWRTIHSTFGVRSVIQFGEQVAVLQDAFIQSLKEREQNGAIPSQINALKVGQSVRITEGPFDGLIARIIEMKDADRLTVLMSMLGGAVRVRLDSDDVQPL